MQDFLQSLTPDERSKLYSATIPIKTVIDDVETTSTITFGQLFNMDRLHKKDRLKESLKQKLNTFRELRSSKN